MASGKWKGPATGVLALAVLLLVLAGCGADEAPSRSQASFAVVSDPHLYDAEALGTSGADYAAYLAQDPKLLAESEEILDAVVADLVAAPLDFVIVTGDMTKDGELINHRLMAEKLAAVTAGGKKVYVIPGNHDIANPQAVSYRTSPPSPVPTVTAAEFRQLYADFGYGDALFSDPDSLSYVAEPVPGLWLFAIDSCAYDGNSGQSSPAVAGALAASTQAWLADRLAAARARGKTVIGMMHHGSLEHLAGQAVMYPEYLVSDWENVSRSLAENGLHLMFTGHFHANDITKREFAASTLYDVETGSLVTYPSPYRVVACDLVQERFTVSTLRVNSIPSHAADFPSYSRAACETGMTGIARQMLSQPPYSLGEPTRSAVADFLVEGMLAHYAGDEAIGVIRLAAFSAMQQDSDPAVRTLGQALLSLWTDLPPWDSNVVISPDDR